MQLNLVSGDEFIQKQPENFQGIQPLFKLLATEFIAGNSCHICTVSNLVTNPDGFTRVAAHQVAVVPIADCTADRFEIFSMQPEKQPENPDANAS